MAPTPSVNALGQPLLIFEEGMKGMVTFMMGTKNTKRPEKLPVRNIVNGFVQSRMWRGWILFSITFV